MGLTLGESCRTVSASDCSRLLSCRRCSSHEVPSTTADCALQGVQDGWH